jgi:hypothetical protein
MGGLQPIKASDSHSDALGVNRSLPPCGQEDHSRVVVGAGLVYGRGKFIAQLRCDRVVFVRAGQYDREGTFVALGPQGTWAHIKSGRASTQAE